MTPYKMEDGRKVELPNEYQHAWEGADGRIVVSSNGQYDPNTDQSLPYTRWKQMPVAK